jgi:hypothetical protein
MDPVVLFFLLGVLAKLARSDLRLPEALYETLSIFLLLAIGLKGGVELARLPFASVAVQALAVVAMGFVLPLPAYALLRRAGRLARPDAASIAAHYGSVSVVTFAVAVAFLTKREVPFETHMPLFVALLETPAIVTGILLARLDTLGTVRWWRGRSGCRTAGRCCWPRWRRARPTSRRRRRCASPSPKRTPRCRSGRRSASRFRSTSRSASRSTCGSPRP